VNAGWIEAKSLWDGSLDLEAIAEMNEMLDIKVENDARWQRWIKDKR
jgi:hypothetical protein